MSSHNDSFVASGSSPTPDFLCENHGSIFLLRPVSPASFDWIASIPGRMHNNKRVSTKRLLARQKQMVSPHVNRRFAVLNLRHL
jgi:hypothetical protein